MLLGYGSDKWWRVEVIVLFALVVVVLVWGAYGHFTAPVRLEVSVVDSRVVDDRGEQCWLVADVSFSNSAWQKVTVTDVSLRLPKYTRHQWYRISGQLEHSARDAKNLILPPHERTHRTFRFPVGHRDVTEGLDIHSTGRFVLGADLLVTVSRRLGAERWLVLDGLTAVVADGRFVALRHTEAVATFVGY